MGFEMIYLFNSEHSFVIKLIISHTRYNGSTQIYFKGRIKMEV